MALDKLIDHLISLSNSDRDSRRATPLGSLKIERTAGALRTPTQRCLEYHRGREEFYTGELEKAEKDLRENGISLDAIDQLTGMVYQGHIASGAINSNQVNFQPRVDQKLLDRVKRAKDKMLEHRNKAVEYEKWLRVFRCAPADYRIELTTNEVTYFRLEE